MPQIASAIAPKNDPLTHADKQIIAQVLTWDTQREVTPEEVETIAITHDIVWVKLTDNRAIPLHVETFRSIRRQQLEAQPDRDDDVKFVMALETKLQADANYSPAIEVDSTGNGIYRVWKGRLVIGLVKRCPRTRFWIAEPAGLYNPRRYPSSELAISAVVRAGTAL